MDRSRIDTRFRLLHALLPLLLFTLLVRGAHFASHNVWSAGICWYIPLVLYVCLFRGRLFPETAPKQQGDLPR
jgi:membrane-associated PAP2 superfamily phosphatase